MIRKLCLGLVFGLAVFFGSSEPGLASTSLTVNCATAGVGGCSIVPASTPFIDENDWFPGSFLSPEPYFAITNSVGANGYTAVEAVNYTELNNLGAKIVFELHRDSAIGPMVYGGVVPVSATAPDGLVTLQTFRDDGYFTIDAINNGQTKTYYATAYMIDNADNSYQASQVRFDLNLGIEYLPIPPTSASNTPSDGDPAPKCDTPDMFSSAPSGCRIVSSGPNTITLAWDSLASANAYAIFFTRDDGEQYSALPSYVGGATQYTIRNLAGGRTYSYQILGYGGSGNLCSSPRCSVSSTASGGEVTGRPIGEGGQVLGETTEASPSASPTVSPSPTGEVLGSETCTNWALYIPWILLLAQLVLILGCEYYYRKDEGWTKHYLAVGVTLLSIFIFYLVRQCDCAAGGWLAWLCQWYWLVSVILTLLLKLFSYAFLEDIAKEPEKKKPTLDLEKK